MIQVMRKAPGVGLAAPQIGIPLRVILNPKLDKKGKRIALFFEGCLRCPSLLPLFALSEYQFIFCAVIIRFLS
ncbi:hypothetical protein glysoja_044602 [Glycine soja]|uniref:Peptide deformylase n=1 Tax=Glycine soja TaxID=3848 RepID=A0A0B2SW14_GLYSO|nr:hypothetical protein glysoja_044602 [Glycine soja]